MGTATNSFNPSNINGRRAWVKHGAGTTFYSYNGFGDVTAVFEAWGSSLDTCNMFITRYTYDNLGRLTSVTYPTQRKVEYVYASGTRPTSIQFYEPGSGTPVTLATSITYDVDGRVKSYTAGAVALAADFNFAGQTKSRTYSAAAGQGFNWKLTDIDASGNPKQLKDDGTLRELNASYDGQDRLASALGTGLRGNQDCVYTYDDSGNRILEECYDHSITYSYTAGTSRLESLSWTSDGAACGLPGNVTRTITRDALGRATSGWRSKFATSTDSYTLTYGYDGLVTTATTSAGTATYKYDHKNLRLYADTPSPARTRRFAYDPQGHLLTERINPGPANYAHEYVWLAGEPIAVLASNGAIGSGTATVHVLGTDQLGTPMRAWSRTPGTFTWAADYEAFGRARTYVPGLTSAPAEQFTMRLPGQVEDAETGLHWNWWRLYSPDMGSYLQPDPLVSLGIPLPAFRYADAAPLLRTDAMGLYVKNSSGSVIWVKPENGPWVPVGPGDTYDGSPDGVSSDSDKQAFYGRDWLPDNDVDVDDNGDISCVGGLCEWLPDKPWPGGDDDWVPPPDRDDRVCR